MTAEVGVLNRIGVALAADSAVTIGSRADKIWTSADKLFQLSEANPVGAMIYGNADFVGVPWETIIKTYRKVHANESFDTVKAHAEHFLRFLGQARSLFPTARQEKHALLLCAALFFDIRNQMKRSLDTEAEKRDSLRENEISPILADVVRSRLRVIRAQPLVYGLGQRERTRLKKRFQGDIRDLRVECFGNLPMSAGTSRSLTSIAIEMLTRTYFGPMKCGLVFAGFGADQFMPALVSYELEEMAGNKPRVRLMSEEEIGDDTVASVIPFAQQEMVRAFMDGIDPRFMEFMKGSASELFEGTFDLLLSAVEEANPKLGEGLRKFSEKLDQLTASLFTKWEEKQRDYWTPVMENIASLPKDELASMAEAFVNLTKFRRRATIERETVGGPIDVAVITKGDGFVWVKRKHYFPAEKNPRVIGTYMRGER